nr:uncharacterized protein LOC121129875 [Lepeophtheirus salmonis]
MFDLHLSNEIKNEKIMRWRIELACFKYDIVHRDGRKNVVADNASRIFGSIVQDAPALKTLHNNLSHSGVSRLSHFIRSRNLPHSLEDTKRVIRNRFVCSERKPCFYKGSAATLIKTTIPFERLSVDFIGTLSSASHNKNILTIVDEYSRFPFAYPCLDMSSKTGKAFMSNELKKFLTKKGIATSRSSPYNPRGNGQVERYNGIIWMKILLNLKTNILMQ